MRVTRPIYMRDMTDACVWRDVFICVTWLVSTSLIRMHDMCVTDIHVCDTTHPHVWCVWQDPSTCVWHNFFVEWHDSWKPHSFICMMQHKWKWAAPLISRDRHLCVWRDPSICITWPIHMFVTGLIHMCVTWLIHMFVTGLIHMCVTWLIHMYVTGLIHMCVTWLIHMCVTWFVHMCVSGLIHMCVTWLIHMCVTGLIHTCVTWLIHICETSLTHMCAMPSVCMPIYLCDMTHVCPSTCDMTHSFTNDASSATHCNTLQHTAHHVCAMTHVCPSVCVTWPTH